MAKLCIPEWKARDFQDGCNNGWQQNFAFQSRRLKIERFSRWMQ